MNGPLEAFGIDPARDRKVVFKAHARYFAQMDFLIYLKEDCSYRALRLTDYVTVLLHPERDEAVGVKLKSTRHVIERYLAILRAAGVKVGARDAIQMLGIAETALTMDGEAAIAKADRIRDGSDDLRGRYEPEVRRLAREAKSISPKEVPLPIAA